MPVTAMSTCYHLTPEIICNITKKRPQPSALIFGGNLRLSPLPDKRTVMEIYTMITCSITDAENG